MFAFANIFPLRLRYLEIPDRRISSFFFCEEEVGLDAPPPPPPPPVDSAAGAAAVGDAALGGAVGDATGVTSVEETLDVVAPFRSGMVSSGSIAW